MGPTVVWLVCYSAACFSHQWLKYNQPKPCLSFHVDAGEKIEMQAISHNQLLVGLTGLFPPYQQHWKFCMCFHQIIYRLACWRSFFVSGFFCISLLFHYLINKCHCYLNLVAQDHLKKQTPEVCLQS